VSSLSIVTRCDHPGAFCEWATLAAFAASERHPIYSHLGKAYYAATYCDDLDTSFAVLGGNGAPLALVSCNIHEGALSYFGMPIHIFFREDLLDTEDVVGAALREMDRIAQTHAVASVAVREGIGGTALSILGRGCVNRGAGAEVAQHGICDLSLDETALRRKVRKSYQSLLNAGRRGLRLAYFNATNPDASLFEAYRRFHAHEAGRVTRSAESWQAMFDMIARGRGELALGYLNGDELVSGTMTFDGAEVSYYASGVYDRSQFDKPLAHFPLYDAILRSRNRGLRYFDLGLLPSRGSVSEKEYNIGYFKRGFATSVEMHLVWRWAPQHHSFG
jgi:hypothetical protein